MQFYPNGRPIDKNAEFTAKRLEMFKYNPGSIRVRVPCTDRYDTSVEECIIEPFWKTVDAKKDIKELHHRISVVAETNKLPGEF